MVMATMIRTTAQRGVASLCCPISSTSSRLFWTATRASAALGNNYSNSLDSPPRAAVVLLNAGTSAPLRLGSVRSYSRTPPRWRKKLPWEDDDFAEDAERIIIPGQKEIETLNCDHMTPEEIDELIAKAEQQMKDEYYAKFVPNWKPGPGRRKRPLMFTKDLRDFEYELKPEEFGKRWTMHDRRCGALAIKVGMMPVFDEVWGIRYPCTVLLLDKNIVLRHKTDEVNGYTSVCVAAGEKKRKRLSNAMMGQYKTLPGMENFRSKLNTLESPPWLICEFRVSEPAHLVPVNSRIHARHFVPGQCVDVSGKSKGKGFQGGMKRWGFGGMPASHGTTKSHRKIGTIGASQDPGRVWKGKKMPGRMGNKRVTKQNLRIVKIDRGRNLLYLHGHVPGNKGEWVEVRDAIKKPHWNTDKVKDSLARPPVPTFEYDLTIDGSGAPGHEEFMPRPHIDPTDPDFHERMIDINNAAAKAAKAAVQTVQS